MLILILRRSVALPRTPLSLAIGCYVLAILATLPDAAHPLVSIKGVARDLLYILAGYNLCVFFITTRRRLHVLLLVVLAAHAVLAVYGLATQLAGEVRIYGEVAEPFFENHCIYAAFIALSMSVVLSYLFETRTRGRLLLSGVLALWSVAVALTFVRGAWISLCAVVVFYLWMYRRQLSPRMLFVLVVAGAVVALVAGGLQLKYLFEERLAHALDTGYVTNRDRLDRWGAAASMFLAHPLNGVGWAAYADEYFRYIYFLDAYSTDIRMGAHNLYLEIAAESGIIGLAAFAALIAVFYGRMTRLARRLPRGGPRCLAIGLGGAMLSYLVHAFVNNLGPSDKIGVSFWLLFGLLAVVERLAEESPPAPLVKGGV
ncbi:O-antigen ligase family protein [bacterium]|nr:O-antigen ligase family protein [bacterium]